MLDTLHVSSTYDVQCTYPSLYNICTSSFARSATAPHLPLQLSVQRCDNLTLTSNDVSVAWCMAVISSERYYYV